MATVTGSPNNDFIHVAGDGLTAPEGYKEKFATDGDDTIDPGDGDDIVYGGNGRDLIYNSLGTEALFGGLGNDVFRVDAIVEVEGNSETMDGGEDYDLLLLRMTGGSLDFSHMTLLNIETLAAIVPNS